MGTHLLSSQENEAVADGQAPPPRSPSEAEAHQEESVRFWMGYFESRTAARLRQARRTAVQHIGVSSSSHSSGAGRGGTTHTMEGGGEGAPQWLDEADQPHTRWDQDTFFKEWSYLAERHLKKKANTLLQLEQYIWFPMSSPKGSSDADSPKDDAATMATRFLSFFDATQEQRAPYLPLPIPSVWFYEGEVREKWAARYLPAAAESFHYFQNVLAPAVSRTGGSSMDGQRAVLHCMANQLEKIHAVQIRRFERQWPAWVEREAKKKREAERAPSSPTTTALHQWCENEVERWQRSVEDGEFDPEDLVEEDTDAWKEEHLVMQALAEEPLDVRLPNDAEGKEGGKTPSKTSTSLCFLDFWRHTLRRDDLETLHVLTDDGLRSLATASLTSLLSTAPYAHALSSLVSSLRNGTLDMRAAVFCPHLNATWCKWHYAKFGGSSITQYTHTAKRRLMFHYAASAEEVAATAALYYATKPMSSAVDYATPYTYRRSLTALCAQYGLRRMRATQRPILSSAAFLAKAEDAIRVVCLAAGIPFGKRRRAYDRVSRQIALHGAQLLPCVTNVEVRNCLPEWATTETEEEEAVSNTSWRMPSIRLRPKHVTPTSGPHEEKEVFRWPLGGKNGVVFDWPHPAISAMQRTREAGPLTAERVKLLDALRHSGRVEITLWRWVATHHEGAMVPSTTEEEEKGSGTASPPPAQSATTGRRRMEEEVAEWLASSPALREVHDYAVRVWERLQGTFLRVEKEGVSSTSVNTKGTKEGVWGENGQDGAEEEEEEKWAFVCLLQDNIPLQEEGFAVVQLPFFAARQRMEVEDGIHIGTATAASSQTAFLPPGRYRVRVRCFDRRLGAPTAAAYIFSPVGGSHPGLCSDGFSPPFDVYDAVTPVLERFVTPKKKSASPAAPHHGSPPTSSLTRTEQKNASPQEKGTASVFPGSALMPLCRALRKAGVEVPLQTEFEAGQVLTNEGEVYTDRFLALLHESASRPSLCFTEEGEASEDHMAITHYGPARPHPTARVQMEIRAEALWRLFHPGATAAEWASARYDVMARAMAIEREWWWKDPLLRDAEPLGPTGIVPGMTDSPDFVNGAAVHRYGIELCSILTAEGQSYPRDPPALLSYYKESAAYPLAHPLSTLSPSTSKEGGDGIESPPNDRNASSSSSSMLSSPTPAPMVVSAQCRINGRGEMEALHWWQVVSPITSSLFSTASFPIHSLLMSSPPSSSPSDSTEWSAETMATTAATTSSSLEEVLALTESAVHAAQDRHATLTMTKMGPLEREMQVQSFCGMDGLEMGGKYARTYCYAVEKAKQAIEEEYGVAGRAILGVREGDDKERVSDGMAVDRFASATHPEQRKTRFVPRTTMSGQNMEDPTPDQESTWGR